MTILESPETPDRESWGAFWVYAKQHGVRIETLPERPMAGGRVADLHFLCRDVDGECLAYPIPDGCTPDRVMRWRRAREVCRRLKLRMPKDWPIAF